MTSKLKRTLSLPSIKLHRNIKYHKSKSLSRSRSSKSKSRSTSKNTNRSNSNNKKSSSDSESSEKPVKIEPVIPANAMLMENPITYKPYSTRYWKLQKAVKLLPASDTQYVKKLWKLLDNYNVIILTAETGAGKTT